MFARFLDMTVKPGKRPEIIKALKEKVLPIFKRYPGFVDVIPLEVETLGDEPTKFYAISVWHEKRDAEKYEREAFAQVKGIYEPFLTMPILVRQCEVDETIFKMKVMSVAA